MPETMLSDFVRSRRELKYSLTDVMEWSKDLEEKYQSMALLVETLSQANFKKDKKIQQLKKKVQKYKSQAKAKKLRTNPLPTTTPDGKHVILYQELVDLSEEPDYEVIEEQEVEIIEKENIQIKIKEESKIPIAPPSTPNNEVVEIEEEEEESHIISHRLCDEGANEVERDVGVLGTVDSPTEDNIEPALEPDSEEEPEPEMQPSEEPVLEKEEEVEVEVEEEVEVEVEEEEVEEEEKEEEVEEELYELKINGKAYYVTNETNGPIYAITEDEEVGDEVGKYVNGKATFQVSEEEGVETTEEEEIDLYLTKIDGKSYAIENENNGPIYELGFDGEAAEQVGQYVKGKPTFFQK
jgi:hypothetical protein